MDKSWSPHYVGNFFKKLVRKNWILFDFRWSAALKGGGSKSPDYSVEPSKTQVKQSFVTKLLRDGSLLALFSLFIPLDFYLSGAPFNSNDYTFPFCLRKSNPPGLSAESCIMIIRLAALQITSSDAELLLNIPFCLSACCIFLQHCFRITGAQRVGRQRAEQGEACCTAQALGLSCVFRFPQHRKALASAEASDAEVAVLASNMLSSVLKNTVKRT